MATPKALFTPATWSEDDSDEEEHFREMVRLRIRHEERFRDVHDVNVPERRPPDPIWGEPPRTAGAAPRSPDSDVDENADPWGDFGASPRRVIETPGDGNAPARDPPDDDSTFMPRTAEVRSLAGQLAKLGIEVPYQRSPGHEARGDVVWDAAAHEAMLGRPTRPRMKPAVDSTRTTTTTTTRPRPIKRKNAMKPSFAVPASPAKPPLYAPPVVATTGTRARRSRPRRPERREGPVAVSVESLEITSPGTLSESAHFGVYAHLWWSGGGAGAARDESERAEDCFPYPIGFRTRAVVRVKLPRRSTESRRDETAKRLGGVVRRRGKTSDKTSDGDDGEDRTDRRSSSTTTCVLECSVGMSGVGARRDVCGGGGGVPRCSAWDGPCFCIEWAGGDANKAGLSGARTRRWGGGRHRRSDALAGCGRTPGAALAALLETMGGTPKGSGGWSGFRGEEAFGFIARVSTKPGATPTEPPPPTTTKTLVRDRLDELVVRTCRWAPRPVRLRAPHGVGLALVRGSAYAGLVFGVGEVDCSNPSRGKSIDPSIDRSLVAAAVASPDVFVSADGEREYPLLPGYQVSLRGGARRARRVSPRARRGGEGTERSGVRSLRGVPRRAEGRTEGRGVVLRPGWGPRAVLAQGAVAHAPVRGGRRARSARGGDGFVVGRGSVRGTRRAPLRARVAGGVGAAARAQARDGERRGRGVPEVSASGEGRRRGSGCRDMIL